MSCVKPRTLRSRHWRRLAGGALAIALLGETCSARAATISWTNAANGALGINLDAPTDPPSGVTPNDPFDADAGANNLQNFPAISLGLVVGTNTLLNGSLHSTPARSFTIELFRNAAADPSGHGEGDVFVGRTNVITDGAGNAAFSVLVPADWNGWWFTATATDQLTGDTSKFGPAVAAAAVRVRAARRRGFRGRFPHRQRHQLHRAHQCRPRDHQLGRLHEPDRQRRHQHLPRAGGRGAPTLLPAAHPVGSPAPGTA